MNREAITQNGRTVGALASPWGNLASLPDQLDAELHLAPSSGELPVVQEQVGSEVRIRCTQGIVDRTDQHPGLKNRWLCQREVAMVKSVERIYPELQGCPFGQLGILEESEVPDVHSRALKAVSSKSGESAKLRLHVLCIRILGDIACHVSASP